MSRCTGEIALAVVLVGGCGGEPDAWIEVKRAVQQEVTVQVCSLDRECRGIKALFAAADPLELEKTIGVYLDEPAESLRVLFNQSEPDLCHELVVPFTGAAREPSLTLPAIGTDLEGVPGCDDCRLENCAQ